jgi:hypothetical protein
MSWFKSKVEYPTNCRWGVLKGKNADQPMIVRKNASAVSLRSHGSYRARIGIAIRLLEPGPDGLPTTNELGVLNEFEDALANAIEANQDAIHVLTITTSGFREHVFYSKETVDIRARIGGIEAKFISYPLQSYAEPDPEWRVYGEFG